MNKKLKKSLKILLVLTVLLLPVALIIFGATYILSSSLPEALTEPLEDPSNITLHTLTLEEAPKPSEGTVLYGARSKRSKVLAGPHAKALSEALRDAVGSPLETPNSCSKPMYGLVFKRASQEVTVILSPACNTARFYTGPPLREDTPAPYTHTLKPDAMSPITNIFLYHGVTPPTTRSTPTKKGS